MLNFCDFVQVYVFSTNHHLNLRTKGEKIAHVDICVSITSK